MNNEEKINIFEKLEKEGLKKVSDDLELKDDTFIGDENDIGKPGRLFRIRLNGIVFLFTIPKIRKILRILASINFSENVNEFEQLETLITASKEFGLKEDDVESLDLKSVGKLTTFMLAIIMPKN